MSRPCLSRISCLLVGVTLSVLQAAAPVHADAISLTTPAGLSPGDTFRFFYTTSSLIGATSSDISTYNAFVNTDAAGATYDGRVVLWKAVGSTAAVAARDNVGGFGTIVPVYTVLGGLLAPSLTTDGDGLWADIAPEPAIVGLDGSTTVTEAAVWTGSESDGTGFYGVLGGDPVDTGNPWGDTYTWLNASRRSPSQQRAMYAMSEELTVAAASVPEIDPNYVGSVVALVLGSLGLLERRRVRCADTLHAV